MGKNNTVSINKNRVNNILSKTKMKKKMILTLKFIKNSLNIL